VHWARKGLNPNTILFYSILFYVECALIYDIKVSQPGRPQSVYSFMSYDIHMCTVQLRVTAVRVLKVHQATEV